MKKETKQDRVRKLKTSGLSIAEIAEQVGCSQSYVSRIVTGACDGVKERNSFGHKREEQMSNECNLAWRVCKLNRTILDKVARSGKDCQQEIETYFDSIVNYLRLCLLNHENIICDRMIQEVFGVGFVHICRQWASSPFYEDGNRYKSFIVDGVENFLDSKYNYWMERFTTTIHKRRYKSTYTGQAEGERNQMFALIDILQG